MHLFTRKVALTLLALGVVLVALGASAQAAVSDQVQGEGSKDHCRQITYTDNAEPAAEGTTSLTTSSSTCFTSSSFFPCTTCPSSSSSSSSSFSTSSSTSRTTSSSFSTPSSSFSTPSSSVSSSSISTSDSSDVAPSGSSRFSSGVGGTLARTGADPGIFLLVGGGLIVGGILIMRYRPTGA